MIQAWSSSGWSGIVGEEIYNAVSKKADKYKGLDHPLVVAVNISSAGAELHEEAALFGQQALRLRHNANGNEWTSEGIVRAGKALWFDNPKRRNHYPWLRAVMMFHDLAPWTVANVSACLYLNPYVDDSGAAGAADPGLRRGGGRATPAVQGKSFSQGCTWAAGRLAWQLRPRRLGCPVTELTGLRHFPY